ncbi:hypothetical protein ACFFS2_27910 [Streptomyces aurantiacus]|uniref:hypothetical protein n=1 Tax=Streptomyces aurantiacus TaxID=47760 RepID=UPI0016893411|nr:hypothetical protein [Streptomyces aurantiacus]
MATTLLTGAADGVIRMVTADGKPPPVTRTDVRVMHLRHPDGTLAAEYRIAGRSPGECNVGSLSSDPETLTCFAEGSVIYKSCWPDPRHGSADCLTSPWDQEIRIIRDPDPDLSGAEYIHVRTPWALELRDPRRPDATLRCMSLGGATFVIDGQRANWACRSGEVEPVGYALGEPARHAGRPWTVSFWPSDDDEVRQATIATVWK